MSATVYTPSTLLEGKFYRSTVRRGEGIIQEARLVEYMWYGENLTPYLIRVRPNYNGALLLKDFWATVVVRNEG